MKCMVICLFLVTMVTQVLTTSDVQSLKVTALPATQPKEGDFVQLLCTDLKEAYRSIPAGTACSMQWTREVETEPLRNTTTITVSVVKSEHSIPKRTILTIKKMRSAFQGRYTCSRSCPGRQESGALELRMTVKAEEKGKWPWLTLVGTASILGIAMVCVILMVCWGRQVARTGQNNIQQICSRWSNKKDKTLPCNAPPRYSLVIEMDQSNTPFIINGNFKSEGGADEKQEHLLGDVPPSYEEYLKLLKDNGYISDSLCLEPMPPAYIYSSDSSSESEQAAVHSGISQVWNSGTEEASTSSSHSDNVR